MKLVTHQTGPEGRTVGRVLVEEGLTIARELYLGLVIDRSTQRPVLMASPDGGVEIEKVAEETPERIFKAFVDPALGLQPFQARAAGVRARAEGRSGRQGRQADDAPSTRRSSPRRVAGRDQSARSSPAGGDLLALDAKMSFDDNALYRHPDLKELRDLGEEDPLEIEASKFSLNYIKLDGTIGCMVNGAGLAMATMDIIKLAGGEPANFLDVGGGANAEQIKNAFRILMSDTASRPCSSTSSAASCAATCSRRASSPRSPTSACACRSSSAWKAPTSSSASRCSKRAGSISRPPTRWARRPTKVVALRRRRLTSSSSHVPDPDRIDRTPVSSSRA